MDENIIATINVVEQAVTPYNPSQSTISDEFVFSNINLSNIPVVVINDSSSLNIVERAITPYNPSLAEIDSKDKYWLYTPLAGINKIGMAGFNGNDFSFLNSIVSISTAFKQDITDRLALKQNIIDDALNTTNKTIVGAINENKSNIDTTLAKANAAISTANTALTNANTAINTANTALVKADTAINIANTALANIDLKQNKIDNALNTTNKTIVTAINELFSSKVDKVTGERLINADEIIKLTNIAPGAQVNVIESISVNGSPETITDKGVNVIVPTKVSDLTNDSNFQTGTQVGNSISTHNSSEATHSDIRAIIPVGLDYDSENNALSLELPDENLLSINLPVESDEVDGLSPSGTGTQIAQHELRLQELEVRGTWKGLFPTYADLPLTTPDVSFVGGSVIVNDYVEVSIDEEQGNASTKYRVTDIDEEDGTITWTFAGVLTSAIPLATNSSPGLVKGSATTGKSYAEADGTLSLNGWDALNTTVGNKVDKVAGKGLSTNDLTAELKTAYDGAVTDKHTHSNKATLDSITAAYTTAEASKLSAVDPGAQVNVIEVIKDSGGTALSITDKTVTINKTAVGLGNADNTADANKEVLSATKLKTAITIGGVSFDGSSNINLPGVNQFGNQDTTGLANTRCIKVVTTTGTAPNYVITVPEVNDYTNLWLYVKFHQANTGAATINVNGQGASKLQRELYSLAGAGGSWTTSEVRVNISGIYLIKVGTVNSTIKEVDGSQGFLLDHYDSNAVYLSDGALVPNSGSNITIGRSTTKFVSGYFSSSVITPKLNNGANIDIPTSAGIMITTTNLLTYVYPVGSIYMSVVNTSPASFLGGTWAAFGAGRVLLGMGSNGETNYTTVEATGGSENSVAVHGHNIRHTASGGDALSLSPGGSNYRLNFVSPKDGSEDYNFTATNSGTAGGNRMPYITVYMWKRTA